jgi:SAM-dependent methyltransferase
MCNVHGVIFATLNLKQEEVMGKRIIEVGALNVNGSARPILEQYKPKQYVGVDLVKGPGVDIICNAENLLEKFSKNSCDILVSTELLEHIKDWRKTVSNFKNVVKPGGIILLTTRSIGFQYHAFPYDFWRYQIEDFQNIFSDCILQSIAKDPEIGIFAKIIKPENFVEKDLSDYELYSIVTKKRIKELNEKDLKKFINRAKRLNRAIKLFMRFKPNMN